MIRLVMERTVAVARGLAAAFQRWRHPNWLYVDRVVGLDADGIVLFRYYWPVGRKRIPYGDIRGYDVRTLTAGRGQFRVHGLDFRRRWYPRDTLRGQKELAIDFDVGRLIRPVLTAEDPDTVLEIVGARVSEDTVVHRAGRRISPRST